PHESVVTPGPATSVQQSQNAALTPIPTTQRAACRDVEGSPFTSIALGRIGGTLSDLPRAAHHHPTVDGNRCAHGDRESERGSFEAVPAEVLTHPLRHVVKAPAGAGRSPRRRDNRRSPSHTKKSPPASRMPVYTQRSMRSGSSRSPTW